MSGIPARRMAALSALWRVVTQSRKPGTPGLGERLRSLPRLAGGSLSGRYAALGRGRLVLIVLAVAYILSPIDLLPEAVLGPIGLLDDGMVALWLGGALLVETERFLAWERARSLA